MGQVYNFHSFCWTPSCISSLISTWCLVHVQVNEFKFQIETVRTLRWRHISRQRKHDISRVWVISYILIDTWKHLCIFICFVCCIMWSKSNMVYKPAFHVHFAFHMHTGLYYCSSNTLHAIHDKFSSHPFLQWTKINLTIRKIHLRTFH